MSEKMLMTVSLIPSLVAVVVYLNTLPAEFVYDDSRAILSNHDIKPETPVWNLWFDDFWGTPMRHSGSHKSYRPLTVLSFRLNYHLGHLNPFGYHLINVLIHSAVTLLVVQLAKVVMNNSSQIGIVCGLLFAVHPIHTESVAGVVGRAELLSALFYLIAILSYLRHIQLRDSRNFHCWTWLTAALISSFLAMLAKEQGLTALGVVLVYDIFVKSRFSHRRITQITHDYKWPVISWTFTVAVGLVCMAFRFAIMGWAVPEFSPSDNPVAHCDSLISRTLTFAYLAALNVRLLVVPTGLNFDWSMDAIPLVESIFDLRNLLSLAVYLAFGYVVVKLFNSTTDEQMQISPPGSAYSMPKSAATPKSPWAKYDINGNRNISNNNFSLSHRTNSAATTYEPNNNDCHQHRCQSQDCKRQPGNNGYKAKFKGAKLSLSPVVEGDMSASLLLALLISTASFLPASNLLFYVGFVLAERVLYIPSIGYCLLVGLALQKCQKHFGKKITAVLLILLCVTHGIQTWTRNYDWANEESLYRSGVKYNPAKAYANLGNVLSRQGKHTEAEEAYKAALLHRPNMADTHYNLGLLQQERGQLSEAIKSYEKAIQFRSRLAVAHLNLGLVLSSVGKKAEAESVFRSCADLSVEGLKDPKTHENSRLSCLYNLGRLYAEENRHGKALETYMAAVAKLNAHYSPHSLFNMIGESHSQLGSLKSAELWYRKAIDSKNDHLPAYLTLANLLFTQGRQSEALSLLEKAVRIAPSDPRSHQHLAQFYFNTNQLALALHSYQEAYRLQSNSFDIVFALANVHRQLKQPVEAEKFYSVAVKLKPNSANAFMNYGAMLHLNRKYKEAEIHYLRALQLNPKDTITVDNLKKLRRTMSQQKL